MSLPPSSAPTATGWSDSCRAGFAPAEKWRLFTAHAKNHVKRPRPSCHSLLILPPSPRESFIVAYCFVTRLKMLIPAQICPTTPKISSYENKSRRRVFQTEQMVPLPPAECLRRWLGHRERSRIVARNASNTDAAVEPRQTPLVGKRDLADPYRVIWPPSVTDPTLGKPSLPSRTTTGQPSPRLAQPRSALP